MRRLALLIPGVVLAVLLIVQFAVDRSAAQSTSSGSAEKAVVVAAAEVGVRAFFQSQIYSGTSSSVTSASVRASTAAASVAHGIDLINKSMTGRAAAAGTDAVRHAFEMAVPRNPPPHRGAPVSGVNVAGGLRSFSVQSVKVSAHEAVVRAVARTFLVSHVVYADGRRATFAPESTENDVITLLRSDQGTWLMADYSFSIVNP